MNISNFAHAGLALAFQFIVAAIAFFFGGATLVASLVMGAMLGIAAIGDAKLPSLNANSERRLGGSASTCGCGR